MNSLVRWEFYYRNTFYQTPSLNSLSFYTITLSNCGIVIKERHSTTNSEELGSQNSSISQAKFMWATDLLGEKGKIPRE